VRIVADEHVSNATVGALRAAGHDVVTVRDVLGEGTDDGVILRYAIDDGRVVLTRDDDFLGRSESHCGVLYVPDSEIATQVLATVDRIETLGIDPTDGELYVPDGWL
jgi:predicted nuclease of predicted toxin-antitoxin system